MIVGEDFISLGGKLATFRSEPEWRTSISRSYYGIFYHARDFLDTKLQLQCPRNAKSHDLVSKALQYTDIPDLKVAGSILESLRGMRNKADYDIDICKHGAQRVAMDVQVQAQAAKAKIDAIVAEVTLKAAQTAIKANLRYMSGMAIKANL